MGVSIEYAATAALSEGKWCLRYHQTLYKAKRDDGEEIAGL